MKRENRKLLFSAAIRGRGAGGRIDTEKIPKLAQFLKWDNMAMVQAGQGLKAFSFSRPSAMNCADFSPFVDIDIMAGSAGDVSAVVFVLGNGRERGGRFGGRLRPG